MFDRTSWIVEPCRALSSRSRYGANDRVRDSCRIKIIVFRNVSSSCVNYILFILLYVSKLLVPKTLDPFLVCASEFGNVCAGRHRGATWHTTSRLVSTYLLVSIPGHLESSLMLKSTSACLTAKS